MTKATVCHRRRSTARLLLALVAFALALGLAPAGLLLAAPAQAQQVIPREALRAALVEQAPRELTPFYAAHGWQPLWLDTDGRVRRAALLLLGQVEQAGADGIRPSRLRPGELGKALDRIGCADPKNLARVELAASRLYVNWVKALRSAPHAPMQYESDALAPVVPTTTAALQAAAAAQSLDEHVATMAWMHPWYALLRQAMFAPGLSESQRHRIALNMERLRALPAYPADRYVLVDAAGANLWMFERGKPVGSMRVVVGKPDNQTPMMAGFIRYAILNPYWNVPDDLVSRRIASNVRNKGFGYLKTGGYEVLREWGSSETINPALVDWQAVEQGRAMVRVRQLPGRSNFMGKVKFEFPNPLGIYLHDTPEKNLLRQETRTASSGCVRLEDAQRLGRWLLGKPLPRKVSTPEKRMDLPELVPVYITYLTVSPEPSGTLAFNADPYGRDGGMTHLATR